VTAVAKARPEILQYANVSSNWSVRRVALGFLVVAFFTGGVLSWFVSEHPDGLDSSIAKVTSKEEVENPKSVVHAALAALQEKLALLPDYHHKKSKYVKSGVVAAGVQPAASEAMDAESKVVTSAAGLVGGLITLAVAAVIGLLLRKKTASS
jgi:cobalt/nickel transport system permease protein